MTPVRMSHPNHGFMHAYTEDEIQSLKALGWTEERAKSKGEPPVPEMSVLTEAPQKRKYTRKQAA